MSQRWIDIEPMSVRKVVLSRPDINQNNVSLAILLFLLLLEPGEERTTLLDDDNDEMTTMSMSK